MRLAAITFTKDMSVYGKKKAQIKNILEFSGYDYRHWMRPVMYEKYTELGGVLGREFDICEDKLDHQFDLINADQVSEHLLWPCKATRNVLDMLKPGGHLLVTIPPSSRHTPSPMTARDGRRRG